MDEMMDKFLLDELVKSRGLVRGCTSPRNRPKILFYRGAVLLVANDTERLMTGSTAHPPAF